MFDLNSWDPPDPCNITVVGVPPSEPYSWRASCPHGFTATSGTGRTAAKQLVAAKHARKAVPA